MAIDFLGTHLDPTTYPLYDNCANLYFNGHWVKDAYYIDKQGNETQIWNSPIVVGNDANLSPTVSVSPVGCCGNVGETTCIGIGNFTVNHCDSPISSMYGYCYCFEPTVSCINYQVTLSTITNKSDEDVTLNFYGADCRHGIAMLVCTCGHGFAAFTNTENDTAYIPYGTACQITIPAGTTCCNVDITVQVPLRQYECGSEVSYEFDKWEIFCFAQAVAFIENVTSGCCSITSLGYGSFQVKC